MIWKFLKMWFETVCVSFALILIVFSCFDVATEYVGPMNADAAIQLFVMCTLIAVWTSFLQIRLRARAWMFFLLCYVGCAAIVLGLGNATGFIPLGRGTPKLIGTVLFMITAVFAATSIFSVLLERSEIRRINARLAELHRRGKEDPK